MREPVNEVCEVPAWRGGDGKHMIPETEGLGDFSLSTFWILRISGLVHAFVSGDSISLQGIPEIGRAHV